MIHLHHNFSTIQNYGLFSDGPLGQLMVATSMPLLVLSIMKHGATRRASYHRTACSVVYSIFFSHTSLLDGRALHQMPEFMKVQSLMI
jgi:hypothetical protein